MPSIRSWTCTHFISLSVSLSLLLSPTVYRPIWLSVSVCLCVSVWWDGSTSECRERLHRLHQTVTYLLTDRRQPQEQGQLATQRQTDTDTDRQTDRQTDSQTHTQTVTYLLTDRRQPQEQGQLATQTQTHMHRQRHTHTDRQTETVCNI